MVDGKAAGARGDGVEFVDVDQQVKDAIDEPVKRLHVAPVHHPGGVEGGVAHSCAHSGKHCASTPRTARSPDFSPSSWKP